MKEIRYSIVFDGQTLASIPEKTVKSNLAALCAQEGFRLDDLFSGDTFTLKRDLSREDADRFAHDLLLAGAVVRKERYRAEEQPFLQFPELTFTEDTVAGDPPESWGRAPLSGKETFSSPVQSLLQADTIPRVERDILEQSDDVRALEIVEEEPEVFDEAAAANNNWDSPNGFWKKSATGIPAWGESDR
ncbi:MAG: hypothetical protein LBP86_06260 [Azoarcus sp.]|jgi:hypothetical protein|nr:hypothetical protein [Azoarcus sp.]